MDLSQKERFLVQEEIQANTKKLLKEMIERYISKGVPEFVIKSNVRKALDSCFEE